MKNKLIKVSLKPFYGKLFLKNKVFSINNGHNIFFKMNEKLEINNIQINTIDTGINEDWRIYCDMPYPWEISFYKKLFKNRRKNMLYFFESPIVNPFNHIKILHQMFIRIYTWDNTLVDNKKYFKFIIPQLNTGLTTKSVSFKKKKLLILMNSNKSSPFLFRLLSPYKLDLYKERVRAINFFDKLNGKFELYGRGWNSKRKFNLGDRILGFRKYKQYKGEVDDKYSVMSQFKFALCFENCSAPGYITEKIIDCFKSRCVPIYLGADDITDYFNPDTFIDFRLFGGKYKDLLEFIESIDEETYNGFVSKIEKLLANKSFRDKWFEKSFEKNIVDNVTNQ